MSKNIKYAHNQELKKRELQNKDPVPVHNNDAPTTTKYNTRTSKEVLQNLRL
jgi:hypothetical protein